MSACLSDSILEDKLFSAILHASTCDAEECTEICSYVRPHFRHFLQCKHLPLGLCSDYLKLQHLVNSHRHTGDGECLARRVSDLLKKARPPRSPPSLERVKLVGSTKTVYMAEVFAENRERRRERKRQDRLLRLSAKRGIGESNTFGLMMAKLQELDLYGEI